jgi:hypothetical protein
VEEGAFFDGKSHMTEAVEKKMNDHQADWTAPKLLQTR